MSDLWIGLLAFVSSFLGCFQVVNLAKERRLLVGVTSCCIACCQLHVYKLAPHVDGFIGTLSYVTGGLIGAQLVMVIRKRK